jgi:hypothetical protein
MMALGRHWIVWTLLRYNISCTPAMSRPSSVDWMARVERPAIETHIRAKPAGLDKPLRGVVATFAEAHEWAEPEFVDVAVVRLNVVADCRRLDNAPL